MSSNKIKFKHTSLLISILLSILILCIFISLQQFEVKFLKLHYKWIIISFIPLFLTLLLKGYIKIFKGFGVELEANLKEPIPSVLVSVLELTEMPQYDKRTTGDLNALKTVVKKGIKILRFIYGIGNYYNSRAVLTYIEQLPNLQFIEIINAKKEFLFLLPIDYFKKPIDEQRKIQIIEEFIDHIKYQDIEVGKYAIIKDYVKDSDTIIDAYKKIKYSKANKVRTNSDEGLPLLNSVKKIVGLLWLSKIEERIAEDVVKNI